jgi:Skp family chaperone for outer membrane proteins
LVVIRFLWMAMLAGLFASSGCEQKPADRAPGKVTPEDLRRDAGQAAETAAEYSRQTREEFQTKLDARLNELDAEIAKLREKGRDRKDEAKAKWDQKMTELETKRDAARAKLAEVGRSSAEAWKDVRKGAQSAWDDLDKAFRDASREY